MSVNEIESGKRKRKIKKEGQRTIKNKIENFWSSFYFLFFGLKFFF